MTSQNRLHERLQMIENPESRIPCVIVIDTSGSMTGHPIDEVNAGVRRFAEEISTDELTALRADVAIIAFNQEHRVLVNFGETLDTEESLLMASGGTLMAPPIATALDMIERRKKAYQENGIPYYRPIVLLITDGYPNDRQQELASVAKRIKEGEKDRKLTFWPVGTEQANMECLSELSTMEPRTLRGTNFVQLFQWLSSSISRISHSQMGDEVRLPSTDPWAKY